ncbi:MAG: HlyD family secretion protein, partial [Tepidisphaeraceae bacterium]
SQLAELRLPREDLMGKQVSVLRQQIESSRKKIASTEAQLKLREVRTPVAGIVQLHRFEVGEVVKPDHVLAQVFDQRDWVVKLKLPEESFGRVQVGQKVEVAVAAYPTMRYGYLKAKVIRIMPSVTPRQSGNGVYLVEASLEPPSDRPITPGMTVTGYVNGGRTNWLSRWMGW